MLYWSLNRYENFDSVILLLLEYEILDPTASAESRNNNLDNEDFRKTNKQKPDKAEFLLTYLILTSLDNVGEKSFIYSLHSRFIVLVTDVTLTPLTWFEVQGRQRLWVQEVQGGTHGEEHVIVMALVQDDEDQISHLKTEQRNDFIDLRSHLDSATFNETFN